MFEHHFTKSSETMQWICPICMFVVMEPVLADLEPANSDLKLVFILHLKDGLKKVLSDLT